LVGRGNDDAADLRHVPALGQDADVADDSVAPVASRARIASRSGAGVEPSRCSAATPLCRNSIPQMNGMRDVDSEHERCAAERPGDASA
jgi:hypothetical protein